MKTIGFIGCGNMGGALAKAALKSVGAENIFVYDIDTKKSKAFADETDVNVADAEYIVLNCDYIFLGVKPQMLKSLFEKISPVLEERTTDFTLVSMAAGVSISSIQQMAQVDCPIIRIMPNMPASVGEGMILYTVNDFVSKEDIDEFSDAMKFAGLLDKIDEDKIDAASCVSGCGPAFVYMFAESMAKAGAQFGLDSKKATEYAAQTLLGAAKLMLESNKTPETLRKEVCSPNGSTIEGVISLQNSDFDKNVNAALNASFKRTKELGK